jgi:hypothetical protein
MEAAMTNPDVTNEEEIKTWEWIAGISLIAVLLASFLLGGKTVQVADVDPTQAPPIVHQTPDL